MRLHIVHLGLAASLFASGPAFAGSSLLCSQIFTESPGMVGIADLLGRGQSSKLTTSFKLQLAALYQTVENTYGPLELKSSSISLNWQQLKTDALRRAGTLKTSNEQYYLFADTLARLNDGHVSATLPSTLVYRLPVQMGSAEGRYFVNALFDSFPAGVRAPKSGDEIVSIDGVSPADFQSRYAVWNSSGNAVTNRSLFSMTFGFWSEARGLPLSQIRAEGVTMKLRSREDGEVYEIALPFRKQGVGLIGKDLERGAPAPDTVIGPLAAKEADQVATVPYLPKTSSILSGFHRLFMAEIPSLHMKADPVKAAPGEGPMRIGELAPFFKLPEGFKKIELPAAFAQERALKMLMPEGDLLAGTFRRNGKTVGFLRIPSYSPKAPTAAIRHLRYLVSVLEKRTDYLVIDQTNNPGGMVVYSDLIVKALTGGWNEASHMRFSVKPTQGFLRQYLELRNNIAKNEEGIFTPEELAGYVGRLDREYAKIHSAFESGRNLSEPVSMLVMAEFFEKAYQAELQTPVAQGMNLKNLLEAGLGVDVSENQVYTKPVYMMINELDFSGGDATPAILQDYGRVTLLGTRTAGAGGTVENFSFRGLNEVKVSLTTSLMVRKNGGLVENYGVRPDIEVPLLGSDIADRYSNFFERNLQAIDRHLARGK